MEERDLAKPGDSPDRDLLVRDLRDETQTRMLIDEIRLEANNSGVPFTPEELAQYKRGRKRANSE